MRSQVSDHYQKPKQCSIHLQDLREPVDVWQTLSSLGSGLLPHEHKYLWGAVKKTREKVNKKLEEARQRGVIKSSLEAKLTLHVDSSPSTTSGDALGSGKPRDMATALWALAQSERERAEREGLEYDLLSEYFVVSACSVVRREDSDSDKCEEDQPPLPEEADDEEKRQGDGSDTTTTSAERKRPRGVDDKPKPKQPKTTPKRLGWLTVTVERAAGDKCPRCWHWTATPHANLLCASCFADVAKRTSATTPSG
jgi:hypothetical protein